MDSGLIIALLVILIASVIGVYAMTIKNNRDVNVQFAEVFKVMNGHMQNGSIHEDADEFVRKGVCTVQHVAMNNTLTEVKDDIKEISLDVKKLLERK